MDFDFIIPKEKIFSEYIRLGELEELGSERFSIVINGFPYDEGTIRNGGRQGGEKASKEFRECLMEERLYLDDQMKKLAYYDIGDTPKYKLDQDKQVDVSLEEAHELQYLRVLSILRLGHQSIPFLIGGSNDQSYCNVRALMQYYVEQSVEQNTDYRLSVINIDAHFDVRPLKNGSQAHSGSPFRLMIEDQNYKKLSGKFIEYAAKGCSTNQDHYNFVTEHGGRVLWLEKNIRRYPLDQKNTLTFTQAGQSMNLLLQELSASSDLIFFSFDVDSIDSQYCPGVSAPSVVGGLSENEALELCYLAGLCPKVKMIDFSEYNPAVDIVRTGRLLSNMFYQFCRGVSNRPSN